MKPEATPGISLPNWVSTLELPSLRLLVAGPIVRSVTRKSIYVWLATSAQLHGPILKVGYAGAATMTWSADIARVEEVRLGERLFVYLLFCEIDVAPRVLLTYDIEVGGRSILRDLDLGTTGHPLPTFFSPSDRCEHLRFAHGSCRKPHAEGADMLAHLWNLVNVTDRIQDRPQILLLTGDQIYADDVSPLLLTIISRWAPTLFGDSFHSDEQLFSEAELPGPEKRQQWMRSKGFTSSAAGSHLATFREFALMYLMVWSDTLWPVLPENDSAASAALSEEQKRHLNIMRGFRTGLPSVRRLLANIPTYMIFDDHEITDDWNIDDVWRRTIWTRRSRAGRRIILNGLIAYCAFQHLGNPTSFPLTSILRGRRERSHSDDEDKTLLTRLGGLGATSGTHDAEVKFHWRLAGAAEDDYEILCFDVRTYRDTFPPANASARLADRHHKVISDTGFDWQLRDLGSDGGKVLFAVLPPPWLGLPYQDLAQELILRTQNLHNARRVLRVANDEGVYRFADLFDNPLTARESRDRVINKLCERAGAQPVVILSGDVHYSYFSHGTQVFDATPEVQHRLIQLVGSSFKNEDGLTRGLEAFTAYVMLVPSIARTIAEKGLTGTFRAMALDVYNRVVARAASGLASVEQTLTDALREWEEAISDPGRALQRLSSAIDDLLRDALHTLASMPATAVEEARTIIREFNTRLNQETDWERRWRMVCLLGDLVNPRSELRQNLDTGITRLPGGSIGSATTPAMESGHGFRRTMTVANASGHSSSQSLVDLLVLLYDLMRALGIFAETVSDITRAARRGGENDLLCVGVEALGLVPAAHSLRSSIRNMGRAQDRFNTWVRNNVRGLVCGNHNNALVYFSGNSLRQDLRHSRGRISWESNFR